MAAGLEYQVISKIIELQDFHSVQKIKINEDFFYSPECKAIYNYIHNCFNAPQTFGSVPSWELCRQVFPNLQYSPSGDTLNMLCEQLRLTKMTIELSAISDNIQNLADVNPREGMAALKAAAAELSSRHEITNDLLLSNSYEVLLNDYNAVAEGHGLTGLPWPWLELNEATQGIHNGEFIVIYGRPKNMKTWLSLYIVTLMNMWAGARILIYSLEMHPKQIMRRIAAIRAVVNYKSLLQGTLQPHDKERFFQNLQTLNVEAKRAQLSGEIIRSPELMVMSGQGDGGIAFLHAKIREFRPDAVLVDGMYLMKDDRQQKRTADWKAVAHISQDLKRTGTEFDIPIIATAQANRKADKNPKNANLDEIAYSDAIGQDTDFSIRVQKRMDKATKEPELILAFPGSREVDMDELLIHGIPAINFGLKSTVVVHSDDDSGDKESKPTTRPATPPTVPVNVLRRD